MAISGSHVAAIVALLVAQLIGQEVYRTAATVGVFRKPQSTPVAPEDIVVFDGMLHCEDLHYEPASNRLFTACEDAAATRFVWWPPVANFDDPVAAMQSTGSLRVINPETMTSQKLEFEGFAGSLISAHGIDVIPDPDQPAGAAVYNFVVQHPPSAGYLAAVAAGQRDQFVGEKESATIDIFHHRVGSSAARYVRSVRHSLIARPNDVLAWSPTSFYVTNDHFYAEGKMRDLEDAYTGAKWTDTIHVSVAAMDAADPAAGIDARVALSGLHNSNGLGRGPQPADIAITSAAGGLLHLAEVSADAGKGEGEVAISVKETLKLDSTIDNPSYFSDPYANATFDASGYILAGLTRGIDLLKRVRDPDGKDAVMVWFVKPRGGGGDDRGSGSKPVPRLLFEDDGSRISTASTAVLVAIDPKLQPGPRKAWLFVCGFYASEIIAVRIELQ